MDICFYFHWVEYVGMVLLDCWVAIYLTLYEIDSFAKLMYHLESHVPV